MERHGKAPGFYGKLPSHGDFVGRRLPPLVRDLLDGWIQAALTQSRIDLGEAWLPTWLSSPLWRFVAGAGICGEQAWAGVMMPSHDRVGRCFPLLLMARLGDTPALDDWLDAQAGWFARLELLALSTLEERFSLQAFDAALMAVESVSAGCASHESSWAADVIESMPALQFAADELAGLARRFSQGGQSAWWTEGSPQLGASFATCTGLPEPSTFAAFLDGDWQRHGWTCTGTGWRTPA